MRYGFGDYTLDLHRDELCDAGGVIRLDRQVFAVLAYLVQHVWVVAPPLQQVYVYQSPSHIRVFNVQDELTGDPFLPGFRLKLSELFDVEATEA